MNSLILLLLAVAALLAAATLLALSRPEPDRVRVRRLPPPEAPSRR